MQWDKNASVFHYDIVPGCLLVMRLFMVTIRLLGHLSVCLFGPVDLSGCVNGGRE